MSDTLESVKVLHEVECERIKGQAIRSSGINEVKGLLFWLFGFGVFGVM